MKNAFDDAKKGQREHVSTMHMSQLAKKIAGSFVLYKICWLI